MKYKPAQMRMKKIKINKKIKKKGAIIYYSRALESGTKKSSSCCWLLRDTNMTLMIFWEVLSAYTYM